MFFRKYNVALSGGTAIRIPLIKAGSADFAINTDWTPAAGDVKISKDGGTWTNIGTLPSYSNGFWTFVLSNGELTCQHIAVSIVDSATKAVTDDGFLVETFGHASAMYPFDLSDAAALGLTSLASAYHADIQFTRDQANTQDEWTVVWFKNAVMVTPTSPTIAAHKRADGSALFTGTALTQVGSTAAWKLDRTTTERVSVGEAVLASAQATIDGSTRTWYKLIGRDSN